MVAGMSSAILQGVPATTLDTDLWIGLPERQYIRLLNLGRKLGATLVRNTVIALRDGALINFLYRVDGLASFATEWRRAQEVPLHGFKVKVVPLERLIRSKEFIARPKDLAHLPLLRDILASRKLARTRG
jgi:hypothetical protein